MTQEQRNRVMKKFRSETTDLLIATDVAARGLDIQQLSHVINFDVPVEAESYVHRIGRVGRAGREGIAITLAEPREHRLLKNIERLTKHRIAIEKVPSVADLQSRRMEMTMGTLRETLVADDLEQFRVLLDTLTDEFDVVEVALAAVKLAHEAGTGPTEDEPEIPDVSFRPERDERPRPGRQDRSSGGRAGRDDSDGRQPRASSANVTRLFIGAGRAAGIRPKDLVGAIAGESGLAGRDIGAIEIADRFSLVEVPSDRVDQVIAAMKQATIKGKRATIRREKFTRG
jgi:ATP-dependent RNA helicase DeaD